MAEFIGTFALVFAGTGAIVINDVSGGTVTHVGIALTFGLVVMAMIYAVGDISGAHFNPAVTSAFWLSGRFRRVTDPALYRELNASGRLPPVAYCDYLFPTQIDHWGSTLPAGSDMQSFVLELILTFLLDVHHFECLDWCEGKRCHGGDCHWRGHWPGSHVCRADLRSLHESRPLTGAACRCLWPLGTSLDLSDRAGGGAPGSPCLPVAAARIRPVVRHNNQTGRCLIYANYLNSKIYCCLKTAAETNPLCFARPARKFRPYAHVTEVALHRQKVHRLRRDLPRRFAVPSANLVCR